jgi:hypothetical protein
MCFKKRSLIINNHPYENRIMLFNSLPDQTRYPVNYFPLKISKNHTITGSLTILANSGVSFFNQVNNPFPG